MQYCRFLIFYTYLANMKILRYKFQCRSYILCIIHVLIRVNKRFWNTDRFQPFLFFPESNLTWCIRHVRFLFHRIMCRNLRCDSYNVSVFHIHKYPLRIGNSETSAVLVLKHKVSVTESCIEFVWPCADTDFASHLRICVHINLP